MRVAIGLRLETDDDWGKAAEYVVEAERLGVDFVWSHESWGLDAATPKGGFIVDAGMMEADASWTSD